MSAWCRPRSIGAARRRKERSLIRLLLSEDWVIGSRVRRFFTVLFNGRNTTVQLGEPMSLRSCSRPTPIPR